jgi:hypothetical protein
VQKARVRTQNQKEIRNVIHAGLVANHITLNAELVGELEVCSRLCVLENDQHAKGEPW